MNDRLWYSAINDYGKPHPVAPVHTEKLSDTLVRLTYHFGQGNEVVVERDLRDRRYLLYVEGRTVEGSVPANVQLLERRGPTEVVGDLSFAPHPLGEVKILRRCAEDQTVRFWWYGYLMLMPPRGTLFLAKSMVIVSSKAKRPDAKPSKMNLIFQTYTVQDDCVVSSKIGRV